MSDISVLIVDDEQQLVRSLLFALREEGIAARGAHTAAEGLAEIARAMPDLVLLDQRLPDMTGTEVVEKLRREQIQVPVVMISAHGDTRAAVQAVKAGASDYLTKPFELEDLIHAIRSTLEREKLAAEVSWHREAILGDDGMVGDSTVIRDLSETIRRVAASATTRVLLLGESGTGKGLVARSIHNRSARAKGPFVEVNCASLPEQLIEAELFGTEKGAFTGAHQRRLGLVALADGGTLFLDEIGEMPLALQAKLLRVLERRVITRVGGTAEVATDVRVVAATHRDLEAEVVAGRFRQDLLFRIAGFAVAVPPLRDRTREILALAERFVAQGAAEQGRPTPALTDDVRAALLGYAWPGNVRELKNTIERALILCDDRITVADLPDRVRDSAPRVPVAAASDGGSVDVRGQLAEVERAAIVGALAAEGDNQTRAARRLGLSRRALIYKLEKYGLKPAPGA